VKNINKFIGSAGSETIYTGVIDDFSR